LTVTLRDPSWPLREKVSTEWRAGAKKTRPVIPVEVLDRDGERARGIGRHGCGRVDVFSNVRISARVVVVGPLHIVADRFGCLDAKDGVDCGMSGHLDRRDHGREADGFEEHDEVGAGVIMADMDLREADRNVDEENRSPGPRE